MLVLSWNDFLRLGRCLNLRRRHESVEVEAVGRSRTKLVLYTWLRLGLWSYSQNWEKKVILLLKSHQSDENAHLIRRRVSEQRLEAQSSMFGSNRRLVLCEVLTMKHFWLHYHRSASCQGEAEVKRGCDWISKERSMHWSQLEDQDKLSLRKDEQLTR